MPKCHFYALNQVKNIVGERFDNEGLIMRLFEF